MNSNLEGALDIHSENVLAIRRTLIVMSVLLLSLDYRYFSLPDTLSVFQVKILNITSWHIYATTIALLFYVLIKYMAKLREIYSKPNGNNIPRADYWIESEKTYWEKFFNPQLLSYLNKGSSRNRVGKFHDFQSAGSIDVSIFSRRYSSSRNPYARRWMTRILLLSPSTKPSETLFSGLQ